jgi:hypothetical protein
MSYVGQRLDKVISLHIDRKVLESLELPKGKVLIKVEGRPEIIRESGLILPEKQRRLSCTGVVVKTGDFCDSRLQPGTQVIYNGGVADNPKLCQRLTEYGKDDYWYIIDSQLIYAIFEEEAEKE